MIDEELRALADEVADLRAERDAAYALLESLGWIVNAQGRWAKGKTALGAFELIEAKRSSEILSEQVALAEERILRAVQREAKSGRRWDSLDLNELRKTARKRHGPQLR